MKRTLLLVFVCASLNGLGQKFCEFNVYFETAQWKVTGQEQKKIDSVLSHIGKGVKFDIRVTGHTDKRGGREFNQRLSEKRADAVTKYITRNVTHRELNTMGKAFTDMVYTGDDVNAFGKNRRVKVELYHTIPEVSSIGAEKLEREKFMTDNSQNDTLVTKSGTRIFVPSDGFVFEDGSPVKGNVEIGYTEYRDPIDFILGGIPMGHTENGQAYIFNSSGMFNIEGSQGGKKVLIKNGKEIGIDFAKTQDVPNTNFYDFSDSAQQWSNLGPLEAGNRSPAIGGGADHLADARNSCLMENCDILPFLGTTAKRWLEPGRKSLYAELTMHYSYRDEEVMRVYRSYRRHMEEKIRTKNENDSLRKVLSLLNTVFRLEVVDHDKRKNTVRFKIVCEKGSINPYEQHKDVVWEYKYASENKITNWLDTSLFNCTISYMSRNGTANIMLTSKHNKRGERQKKNLRNVRTTEPLSNEKVAEMNELHAYYLSERRNIGRQKGKIRKRIRVTADEIDLLGKKLDSTDRYFSKPFRMVDSDEETCFWNKSIKHMETQEEKEMPLLVWLRHFEQNPEMMRKRYEPFNDPQVQRDSCRAYTVRDSIRLAKLGIISASREKFDNMKASLGISSFGVYNCDQLQRIQKPVEIMAAYKGEDGEGINVASVFMIDHSINSVLNFNGYMDLWPTRFSYGKNSKNTLVAFDEKGVAYICKPAEFAMAVNNRDEVKVFPLKRIGKDATKQEMLAVAK